MFFQDLKLKLKYFRNKIYCDATLTKDIISVIKNASEVLGQF